MKIRWQVAQAAEIRWWQRYLRKQDKETYLARKKAYWDRILGRYDLSPPPGERVLDAGCGPAGVFISLRGRQVRALDPLLDAYGARLPHFAKEDYPWVHFENIALEHFRPEVPFAWVFCLNAINHVADLPVALRRLTGALDRGGTLVITVDVHRSPLLKTIFRIIPGDILHPHQHGPDDYCRMVEAQGLRISRTARLKQGLIFDYFLIVAQRSG